MWNPFRRKQKRQDDMPTRQSLEQLFWVTLPALSAKELDAPEADGIVDPR